jgi:dipeptidyl aminopeptidase/acylaminoacyl peptidase
LSARFLLAGSSVVYGAAWEGSPVRVFSSSVDDPEERQHDLPAADVFAVSERGDLLLGLGRSFRFDWLTGAVLGTAPFGSTKPDILAPSVRAADWSRDGKEVALVRTERKGHVLERPPGQAVYRTSGWIGQVRLLDGDRVAFLDHPVWGDRRGRLALTEKGVVRSLAEGEFETLSGLALSPDEREVLFSADRVGSQTEVLAVDLRGGAVRTVLAAPGALRIHDVAADGRLLVSREEERRTIGFRRGGEPERDLCWTSHAQVAALSADGSRGLVTVFDDREAGTGTSWMRGTDGSEPELLGPGEAVDLSPDGRWAAAIRHGGSDTLALFPVGGGEARTLVLPRVERYQWARFTPDGRALVVSANEPGRRIRLYHLDLATGDSRPVTPEGVGFLLPLTAAGDAVTSEDLDGRTRLFPLTGGVPRNVPGLLPGETVLLWLPGDTAFLAVRPEEVPLRVFRVEVETGARVLHAEVGPSDRNGLRSVWPVAFSRDGAAVAFNVSRLFSQLFVVAGWH